MAEFNEDYFDDFLGAVKKYMQVRGSLSQKDLAELVEVGVSTMSRFLNKRTTEFNPQLIAKIVAKLNIPLHEVIDFVEEDYTDRFVRLVRFYRDDPEDEQPAPATKERPEGDFEDLLEEGLDVGGQSSTARREVKGRIKVGGRSTPISYQSENNPLNMSLGDKIANLSPRQKAYLQDFLNLDMEGRDLIVDLGNNLFRYFKQKGMEL